jgi:hypothetical protein
MVGLSIKENESFEQGLKFLLDSITEAVYKGS